MLLLAQKHLKGVVADKLREKNMQLAMNHFGGGYSQQIAREQAAFAASNGAVSMAARNLMGVPEDAGTAMGTAAAAVRDVRSVVAVDKEQCLLIRDACKDVQAIVSGLCKAKECFADFAETRLMYARKERAEQEESYDLDLRHKKRMMDLDVEADKSKLYFKEKMTELRFEEANAEEIYAKAKQLSIQADAGLQPLPVSVEIPKSDIAATFYTGLPKLDAGVVSSIEQPMPVSVDLSKSNVAAAFSVHLFKNSAGVAFGAELPKSDVGVVSSIEQ